MIFLFHGLYFLLKYLHKNYKRRQILNVSSLTEKPVVGDVEFNLKFDPPVYKLRYSAVQEILIENNCDGKIKKVLEYGCAEMKFLFYLKRLYGINEVLLVDVDEPLLQENLFRVQPQSTDFLDGRSEPLIVSVLSGSISDPDCKVLGADAVIGIEMLINSIKIVLVYIYFIFTVSNICIQMSWMRCLILFLVIFNQKLSYLLHQMQISMFFFQILKDYVMMIINLSGHGRNLKLGKSMFYKIFITNFFLV